MTGQTYSSSLFSRLLQLVILVLTGLVWALSALSAPQFAGRTLSNACHNSTCVLPIKFVREQNNLAQNEERHGTSFSVTLLMPLVNGRRILVPEPWLCRVSSVRLYTPGSRSSTASRNPCTASRNLHIASSAPSIFFQSLT